MSDPYVVLFFLLGQGPTNRNEKVESPFSDVLYLLGTPLRIYGGSVGLYVEYLPRFHFLAYFLLLLATPRLYRQFKLGMVSMTRIEEVLAIEWTVVDPSLIDIIFSEASSCFNESDTNKEGFHDVALFLYFWFIWN
jgi:hypothetical protein